MLTIKWCPPMPNLEYRTWFNLDVLDVGSDWGSFVSDYRVLVNVKQSLGVAGGAGSTVVRFSGRGQASIRFTPLSMNTDYFGFNDFYSYISWACGSRGRGVSGPVGRGDIRDKLDQVFGGQDQRILFMRNLRTAINDQDHTLEPGDVYTVRVR